ncbi:formylmethanofuran dehydrogenase subunit E family protein [Geoalkalibacter halelectricus]|uniref:formylmethanofuran dehydrogenase subunit E family protein n=1 Tax=Geoalkalibacter halelectricus TaxID=2847045 RepID=UPI00266EA8C0|nr:formylmethanofuran dehydrogenase subunit E family protein [Geoalkalibacter halelectricus]MDO3379027.1 formylmethanofuran dehydrogenase subunit E family protein [Geoalkalibacter halelectricus]
MSVLAPAQLFDAIRRQHGHYCPMSTLGGRMGFAARRHLGAAPLRAICLVRSCAVDGIAVATGCREADGSLRVSEQSRHALLVGPVTGGQALCVALSAAAVDLAWQYRRLDEALERERPRLAAPELEQRLAQKARFLDELLVRLRTLPEAELLEIYPIDDTCLRESHA